MKNNYLPKRGENGRIAYTQQLQWDMPFKFYPTKWEKMLDLICMTKKAKFYFCVSNNATQNIGGMCLCVYIL